MMASVVLTVAACGGSGRGDDHAFATHVARRGDIRDIVPAVGEIHADQEIAVPVRSDATVTRVLVRLGQRVEKGAVLATLIPTTPSAEPDDTDAEIDQARIARQVAANRYAKARATFAGLQQLQDRGFVPLARLEAERKDLENERLGLQAAELKLTSLGDRHRRLMSRRDEGDVIRAPCSCVVEDINIRPGQPVASTLTDAFYLSGTGDAMTIRVKVAEQDLSRVLAAAQVRFRVETLPDQPFSATVGYISNRPVKDGRFTYYSAYLTFMRGDPAIRPGMTADVEFVNADSRNVIGVPTKALYFTPPDYVPAMEPFVERVYRRAKTPEDRRLALAMADGAEFGALLREGKRKIFVLKDGRPERRLVRVGAQTADMFEAVSGLAVGERVITGTPRPRDERVAP